eukprot:1143635-Pelagomonas_calceolata.AAC.2
MVQLAEYLRELVSTPQELLIQPVRVTLESHELTPPSWKSTGHCGSCMPALSHREEQELESGAILQAVLEQGKEGGACPNAGDLVSKENEGLQAQALATTPLGQQRLFRGQQLFPWILLLVSIDLRPP